MSQENLELVLELQPPISYRLCATTTLWAARTEERTSSFQGGLKAVGLAE
jgi:hypothetical protein